MIEINCKPLAILTEKNHQKYIFLKDIHIVKKQHIEIAKIEIVSNECEGKFLFFEQYDSIHKWNTICLHLKETYSYTPKQKAKISFIITLNNNKLQTHEIEFEIIYLKEDEFKQCIKDEWKSYLENYTLKNQLLNFKKHNRYLAIHPINLLTETSISQTINETLNNVNNLDKTLNIYKYNRLYYKNYSKNATYFIYTEIEWVHKNDQSIRYAPLFYRPIELLKTKTLSFEHKIKEGFYINKEILQFLQKSYNISLKIPNNDIFHINDIDTYISHLFATLSTVKDIKIIKKYSITNLNLNKRELLEDLISNFDNYYQNPFINYLIFNSITSSISTKVNEDENKFYHLNLDGSQTKAVQDALSNESFILHGPPGTGKTHTLVNIAVENIRNGRSTLILSKKVDTLKVIEQHIKKHNLNKCFISIYDDFSIKNIITTYVNKITNLKDHLDFSIDQISKDIETLYLECNEQIRYYNSIYKIQINGMSIEEIAETIIQIKGGFSENYYQFPNDDVIHFNTGKINKAISFLESFDVKYHYCPVKIKLLKKINGYFPLRK
jgi:flagellar biosynthesis GTPase FlhF